MIGLKRLYGLLAGRKNRSLDQRYCDAIAWIRTNSIPSSGIRIAHNSNLAYPEVTGYFIPTLLECGERTRALAFARWLVTIQNEDGSWSDPGGATPYTFDTGQILKGLLSLVNDYPEFRQPILRGAAWLCSMVQPDGRVITPDTKQWRLPDGRIVPEAIHLYALQPLREIGKSWRIEEYEVVVRKSLNYYLLDEELTKYTTLSHFHAYVIEALVDLGAEDRARDAMYEIARLQLQNGFIPAYADSKWTCSTGLFQYALIWYKLGERELADKTFSYACSLQRPSGGFFGGYGPGANYFPKEEISWAVKYFLDAFWQHIRTSFDSQISLFSESIDINDGRFQYLLQAVRAENPCILLDLGCGKGRYLRRLHQEFPAIEAWGADISSAMLEYLPEGVGCIRANLLNLPCSGSFFDLVFCVESLEHAVDIPNALMEVARVLRPGGLFVVIDKNAKMHGQLQRESWEKWIDPDFLSRHLAECGLSLISYDWNLSYNGNRIGDHLFFGCCFRKATESQSVEL